MKIKKKSHLIVKTAIIQEGEDKDQELVEDHTASDHRAELTRDPLLSVVELNSWMKRYINKP